MESKYPDFIKNREEGKDQISIHKSSTVPETYGKVTKTMLTQGSQEASPFLAGDHKAAMNRQDSITKTNLTHK